MPGTAWRQRGVPSEQKVVIREAETFWQPDTKFTQNRTEEKYVEINGMEMKGPIRRHALIK